jgi:hypothetical protein
LAPTPVHDATTVLPAVDATAVAMTAVGLPAVPPRLEPTARLEPPEDDDAEAEPAGHDLRRLLKILLLTAIIMGAAGLAVALIAGSFPSR